MNYGTVCKHIQVLVILSCNRESNLFLFPLTEKWDEFRAGVVNSTSKETVPSLTLISGTLI